MKERLYYLFKNTTFKENFMEFFVKQFISTLLGFVLALLINDFYKFIVAIIIFLLLTTIVSIFFSSKQHQFDILNVMKQDQKKSNWIEIIRLGYPLSRPLWLSGRYHVRIEMGEIIKNAASRISCDVKIGNEKYESKYILASVLIDDLGWTRFIIGQSDKALLNIKEGIRIAEENSYWELAIKGNRHLVGILSKNPDQSLVEETFKKIEQLLTNLDSSKQKEINAGLHFSKAEYYNQLGNCKKAEALVKKAQKEYLSLEDYERYVKTFDLLGNIYIKMGQAKYSEAETVINSGVELAQQWQRKERYIRLIILLIQLKTLVIAKDNQYTQEEYFRDKCEIDQHYNNAKSLCKEIQNKMYFSELNKEYKHFIKKAKKVYHTKIRSN